MNYSSHYAPLKVSCLGFGAMRLPLCEDGHTIDTEKATALIRRCYENGITYFDTAYIYHEGKSENCLAKALQIYPRESYCLADKFNFQAQPDYRLQFEEQLRRLETDYIDFYLIHGVRDDFLEDVLNCGAVEFFNDMKKQGKIRHFGFSFHGSPDGFRRMLSANTWDFAQIQMNCLDWQFSAVSEIYGIADAAGLPLTIMEPLRGGKLAKLTPDTAKLLLEAESERSVASWFMRWLMRYPRVAVVLSGMSAEEQAADNLKTFSEGKALTDSEAALVETAAAKYRDTVAVACTGCRYCCDNCPSHLNIPQLLNQYNDIKLDDDWRASLLRNFPEEQRPDSCIGCGSCTAHCPQGIAVPQYMAEMAELMERIR